MNWLHPSHLLPTAPVVQVYNSICEQRLGALLCETRKGKLGFWLPGVVFAVLIINSFPWLRNRFYKPANSLSNHCFKSSSFHPDTYQVSRAAFYFCPRGWSFSAIATYSGKVICSGCFCPKDLKTSCVEWLAHQPFHRTFYNSHFRCVGGRKSTHGPETLTTHPFYTLYGLFCPTI